MPDHTVGDGPIEARYIEIMRKLAGALDGLLNDDLKGEDRHTGFVLLVFPLNNHEGRCNYISNGRREDVVTLLKEQIKRFEGQPEVKGNA